MAGSLAETILAAVGGYYAVGLLFALAFVLRGLDAVERGAGGGSWGFKVLIVPGCALLWPLLLRRWIAARGAPPDERSAHLRGSHR